MGRPFPFLHPSQGGYCRRGSPPRTTAVRAWHHFTVRPPKLTVAQRERVAPNGRRHREPVHRRGGQGWTSRPMIGFAKDSRSGRAAWKPRFQNTAGPSVDGPGEDLCGHHTDRVLSFSEFIKEYFITPQTPPEKQIIAIPK
jgi:hypothetical protein